ncbi:MAG: DUF3108 domain-containing protein [Paracoccaceae bacterium]
MKHAIATIGLAASLLCYGSVTTQAQETNGQYSVHALGVKVGDMALVGSVTPNKYAVSSQFVTSGLVATVAGVRFLLSSSGARKGAVFSPRRYEEDMDTGRRQSRVKLRWSGGVAKASGSEIGDPGPYAVTAAQQRGAVDPLTAMFMAIRDQSPAEVCKLQQKIYDGERLTQITLTNRRDQGGRVICSGTFRRVAGYSPEDLRERGQFGLTVTYEPAGELLRAIRVEADTIYGKARIQRK